MPPFSSEARSLSFANTALAKFPTAGPPQKYTTWINNNNKKTKLVMERVFSHAALLFVSVFFACQEAIHAATAPSHTPVLRSVGAAMSVQLYPKRFDR